MNIPDLPPVGWAAVAVLAALYLTLVVVTLVRLVRTPDERLTLPRVAWVLIVLLVSTLGPIAFWVAGRRPAPAAEPTADPGQRQGADVVDVLYGKPRQ